MMHRPRKRQSPQARPMALVGKDHPALHTKAAPVDEVTDHVRMLAARMHATLKAKGGIAIAAPQVGESLRLVVSADGTAWANPSLTWGPELDVQVEGCLSLPGRHFVLQRATTVTVTTMALTGTWVTFDCDDPTLARAWQHEVDHLDGILVSDKGREL